MVSSIFQSFAIFVTPIIPHLSLPLKASLGLFTRAIHLFPLSSNMCMNLERLEWPEGPKSQNDLEDLQARMAWKAGITGKLEWSEWLEQQA